MPNSAKQCKTGVCSIPLGSPTVSPKQLFPLARLYCAWPALTVVWLPEAWLGGYTGWVLPQPTQPATAARRTPGAPSGAGPGSPAGARVGGVRGPGITGDGGGTVLVPPYGPGRSSPAGPPCTRTSQNAALQPITARFHQIYCKVSQNGQVSLKYHQKACHSPCFHFDLRKSPLEILRFPF